MKDKLNIKINCHSSICINDNIYIDPYKIEDEPHNASVIFITHPHYDHLDLESIKKVLGKDSVIVCTASSAEVLDGKVTCPLYIVWPNKKGEVKGIKYSTFPAYNVGHHHFKELGFVGFVLEIDGKKYTICGDTDATKELEQIKTEILLIPIGGTYTMNAKEAANLTNIIKPKVVIPTHYNTIVGSKKDEQEFIRNLSKDIKVLILVK